MAQVRTKVIIDALDNASGVFKDLAKNIESHSKKAGGGVKGAAQGMISAFAAVKVSTLAVAGAIASLGAVATKFAVDAAKYEGVRNAFGTMTAGVVEDTDKFINAIRTASAGTLSNMEIMKGAVSAFTLIGREAFPDFEQDFTKITELITKTSVATGESVDYLFDSFVRGVGRASPLILDNLKIQVRAEETNEAYARSIGKAADELTFQEQKTALLIESTRQLEEKFGDVDISGGNLALSIQAIKANLINLITVIGQAVTPGVEILADLFSDSLSGALEGAESSLIRLQYAFLGLAGGIRIAINVAVGAIKLLVGAFKSLISFSFKPVLDAAGDIAGDFIESYALIETKGQEIADRAVNGQVEAVKKGTKQMIDAHSAKSAKIARDLEKETEKFQREMAKREQSFKENLADLIFSHIDKRDKLEKDMADENRDFKEKMDERVKDFEEAMLDIEARHKEKVERIKEQIADEILSQEEANEKRINELERSLRAEEQKFDQQEAEVKRRLEVRLSQLEKNYEMEQRFGEGNQQELFRQLQDKIKEEKAAFEVRQSLAEKFKADELAKFKTDKEAELALEQAEDIKKLTALQEELAKEEEAFKAAKEKKEQLEVEETAKLKEEHNRRVSDLQERLDKEKSILSAHQSDVDAVKDKAREDDIARLKRQHEEEKQEAEANHLRKKQEIREQGAKEGAAYGGGIGSGLAPELSKIEENMKEAGKTAGKNFAEGIKEEAKQAGHNLVEGIIQGAKNKIKELGERIGIRVSVKEGSVIEKVIESFQKKQTGGIVPGPVGAPVPIIAHGQERITPAGVAPLEAAREGGGGNTFQVFIGLYAGSETEKRNIAQDLYGALVQVAEAQNKSVQELMGR